MKDVFYPSVLNALNVVDDYQIVHICENILEIAFTKFLIIKKNHCLLWNMTVIMWVDFLNIAYCIELNEKANLILFRHILS